MNNIREMKVFSKFSSYVLNKNRKSHKTIKYATVHTRSLLDPVEYDKFPAFFSCEHMLEYIALGI